MCEDRTERGDTMEYIMLTDPEANVYTANEDMTEFSYGFESVRG